MKDLIECSIDELLTERQNAIEAGNIERYRECNELISTWSANIAKKLQITEMLGDLKTVNSGVKFMVVYTKYADQSYVVGFANSMEDFMQTNNKRSYPYSYKEEDLKLVSLSTDVFALASIEGTSNFVDYLR